MRSLLTIALLAGMAAAHPLPSLRYDRVLTVAVDASGVRVSYRLELSPWSRLRDPEHACSADDLQTLKASKPGEKLAEKLYATNKARVIADRLIVMVSGEAQQCRLAEPPRMKPNLDHEEYHFQLFAPWPTGFRNGTLEIDDANFENCPGDWTINVTVDGVDLEVLKSLNRSRHFRIALLAEAVETAALNIEADAVIEAASESFFEALHRRGLSALFQSKAGLAAVLGLAFLFGAAHALTPGHGKALVAAYLIGERGTARQAIALGLSTTLAHTGSVIVLAAVLHFIYKDAVPADVQGGLQLAGGLMIALLGFWLLRQRLRNRADHFHFHSQKSFGWWRVVLLGLAAGLVPCWDAVLLLLLAIGLNQLGFAIPLLIAFSLGLATVLVLLGLAVVAAARRGGALYGEKRWFRALPVISAALLAVLGLLMAREGINHLSALAKGP